MIKQTLSNGVSGVTPPTAEIDVGRRLRELRAGRGLSIRSLAEPERIECKYPEPDRKPAYIPQCEHAFSNWRRPCKFIFQLFLRMIMGTNWLVHQKAGGPPHAAVNGSIEDLGAGMPRFGAEPLIVTLAPTRTAGRHPSSTPGVSFLLFGRTYRL